MKTTPQFPNSNPSSASPIYHAQVTWWRISGAILLKDLGEAIKNKNILTIMITGTLLVIFYRYLPTLSGRGDTLSLLVYDAGGSTLTAQLESSPELRLHSYPNEERFRLALSSGDVPELGLIIPAGFDLELSGNSPLELQGYILYWVKDVDAQWMKASAERELSRLAGRTVTINLEGNRILPSPEADGLNTQANFGLLYVLIIAGLTVIPHMMIDEKQSHTFELLMISPASPLQVVAAKAITGLIFTLLGACLSLAVNADLVLHWWLVLLTVLLSALFFATLGLCIGLVVENRGQLSIWSWSLILPLLMPIILVLLEDLVPAWLAVPLRWVPSISIFQLLRYSFSDPVPTRLAALHLAYLAANLALWLPVAAWLARRQEQVAAGESSLWRMAVSRWLPVSARSFPRLVLATAAPAAQATVPPVTHREVNHPGGMRTSGLGIVAAVIAKDIYEAFHNKLVISILFGTSFILVSSAVLPILIRMQNKPFLVAYDEGHSTVLRRLATQEDMRLYIVRTQEELESTLTQAVDVRLGLVIPVDFDQRVTNGDILVLQGYTVHWSKPEQVNRLSEFFSERLCQGLTCTVQVSTAGHALYPPNGQGGLNLMLTMSLAMTVLTLGIAMVPLLLVEEKQNHTLEVMLVSPASLAQVAAGKALSGGLFCLLALAVGVLAYNYLFVHWGVLLLVALLIAAFSVTMGMLVGSFSDNPTSVSLWGGLLLLAVIASSISHGFASANWPPFVISVLPWLPGSLIMDLLNLTMVEKVPGSQLWSSAAALLAMTAAIYALTIWKLKRWEQGR